MSSKFYMDNAAVGLNASHNSYGDVELIGRVNHDGYYVVWIVKCWEKDGELKLVCEEDLFDFYYWGR